MTHPATASLTGDEPPGLVVLFITHNWYEAYQVINALDGHDIPSLILDDNICRMNGSLIFIMGGAKVLVSEDDAEAASDVLRLVYAGERLFAGGFMTVPMSALALFITVAKRYIVSKIRDADATIVS